MADSIQLSASMRTNLLQLQKTQEQIGQKQNILSTGNKINSALDGPTSFFAAKNLSQRAGDLTSLKDAMGQSISTIKAADKGLTSISDLIEQARGLTTAAYGALGNDAASVATRKNLASQFNQLKDQIDALAQDSGYNGKNLIAGNGLKIDSTSTSRQAVNALTGVGNATVTNVVSADTYSIRVSGNGKISANATDINNAETARGLTGLQVTGNVSSSLGSFSDVSIETRGAVGQVRTFIVSDGNESRTTTYFDNTQAMSTSLTTAAKSGVAQVSTASVSGTVEAGDMFTVKVEGQTFTYTATTGDVKMGQNAAANVVSQLKASISTALTGSGRLTTSSVDLNSVTAAAGSATLTLTGKTDASTAREVTLSASTENALSKTISESFASGSVVSFTVDRKLLESAANGGTGTSTIEKNFNIQVDVTNLQGNTVTRSGMNARGEGKLSDGANSFSFDTGTVRLDLDQSKIMKAASTSAAANIVTKQVTDANTSNDLSVSLNERGTNNLKVAAQNLTTSGQGLRLDAATNGWTDRADIDKAVKDIDTAKAKVRSVSQTLSTNLNIITTRENFTKEFSDVLTEGASKLTLADQNEEGANLLMLQTRQQLGTIALSLANQSQQSILRLF